MNSAVMIDAVTAEEFPFVEAMPKQKGRMARALLMLAEVQRVGKENGGLFTVAFACELLEVSRARVYDLRESGVLQVAEVGNQSFITGHSLEAFVKSERKAGRPVGVKNMFGVHKAALRSFRDSIAEINS